jgi:hypothetical protein
MWRLYYIVQCAWCDRVSKYLCTPCLITADLCQASRYLFFLLQILISFQIPVKQSVICLFRHRKGMGFQVMPSLCDVAHGGVMGTLGIDQPQIGAGIFKKPMGARHRGGIGFSYRPARLHRLAEFIPWNQFRGPINI